MEKVDILIIGAGVVGLATAYELSKKFEDVVLVEQEETFGRHTSSRNSEVIHSGLYYPQSSLKAELCVNGNKKIYEFADKYGIPFNKCGKLVVANTEQELKLLQNLKTNGELNNLSELSIMSEHDCKKMEPHIKAKYALKVPSTGVIDSHKLMYRLAAEAEKNGAFIVYDMQVKSIAKQNNNYVVEFANNERFQVNTVINCAGLFSDKIAQMVGIDIEDNNLELHWCKGEYYRSSKIRGIEHLIYPVPDPKGIFLGIHLTLDLNGNVRFGPNAYYVDEIDYSMDETYKEEFIKAINQYIDLDVQDLQLDDCGIRAKLQKQGEDFRDFYIKEESEKGYPKFINSIGIESPGLTASLSIAEMISSLVKS